jgi:hypothetical protein
MTTAVTKGTLRLGEVGPEISGPAGSVLTFGENGRTLSGQPAANARQLSALELFSSEIVAAGATTTGADGPVHTAADLLGAGVAAFPAGATLALEWISKVAATGAGDVFATLELELSTDGGATWNPLTLTGRSTFTAPGLNNPITNLVELDEFDLSGLPSFAIRPVYGNADVSATVSASFGEPRVRWQYIAP